VSASAVGFIGLGNIGKPMAQRLADWPHGLWVCDLDEPATAALAERGATVASSPRQVAEHAVVICVMVRDDAQVLAVVDGPDGVLAGAAPGSVIVVHSTVRPDTVSELVELARPHDVHVLDAPVSGGAGAAQQGTLAIMVGGEDAGFKAAQEALERLGTMVVHLGPAGAGTAAKLARNLVTFASYTAAAEAMELAGAAGIDLVRLGEIVRYTDTLTGGPGAIMWRGATGPLAPDDPWYPLLDHTRELGEKDLSLAVELAGRLEVDVPVARLALGRLAHGLGVERVDD
jgi:3-hydroxyisobutyrate dehydrogenase